LERETIEEPPNRMSLIYISEIGNNFSVTEDERRNTSNLKSVVVEATMQ
jgi:hypothetical protein